MSRSNRQSKAVEVYKRTKEVLDELAQLAFELLEERQLAHEDDREKEVFDALEDVRQSSAELCALWDAVWGVIGEGEPDPLEWTNRDFEAVEPDDDTWARRHRKRAGKGKRKVVDADDASEEESEPTAEDFGLDLDDLKGSSERIA